MQLCLPPPPPLTPPPPRPPGPTMQVLTGLHEAAKQGDLELAKRLLEEGKDINEKVPGGRGAGGEGEGEGSNKKEMGGGGKGEGGKGGRGGGAKAEDQPYPSEHCPLFRPFLNPIPAPSIHCPFLRPFRFFALPQYTLQPTIQPQPTANEPSLPPAMNQAIQPEY